jgi:amino acid transporter
LSQGAQQMASTSRPHLSRQLGMWAIVGLGLGYMTPMTVFDTFEIVSGDTDAAVPLAYLAALVAMIFTAISYGRMTRVYPSAGSAYTYASETIHPNKEIFRNIVLPFIGMCLTGVLWVNLHADALLYGFGS